VNLEDIKSPLPPRQVSPETETRAEPETNTSRIPEPEGQERVSINPPPPVKTKKIDLKKYLPITGIVLVSGLILVTVFKVIIPKLKPGGNAGGTVTLNYWGLWEEKGIVSGVIEDFEAKNPGIKINYVMNSKINYRTILAGRLEKTEGAEEVPDIFRIHSSWIPMFKENLKPVPATVAKNIGLDEDFYNVYKKDLKEKGQYLAVPLMYDSLMLYYNKDKIQSAQKSLPKTWWGLRNTAKELTVRGEDGQIDVAGVAMGITGNVDHWSDIVGLMMLQNGVDMFNLEDSNSQKKLEDILTFYTLFRTADEVWDENLANSTLQFASNKLVFYFAPSWRAFNLDDMNKDLKFEITTVPQLPTSDTLDMSKIESGEVEGGLTNKQWGSYWVEGVNSESKNQKEAWKFLEYLASKEGLEKLYTTASQARSFGEIYPRKSMATLVENVTRVRPFLSVADQAQSGYLSSRTFDDGLNEGMIKYFETAIGGIVDKNMQPVQVMPDLLNGIRQSIEKYRLKPKE